MNSSYIQEHINHFKPKDFQAHKSCNKNTDCEEVNKMCLLNTMPQSLKFLSFGTKGQVH